MSKLIPTSSSALWRPPKRRSFRESVYCRYGIFQLELRLNEKPCHQLRVLCFAVIRDLDGFQALAQYKRPNEINPRKNG